MDATAKDRFSDKPLLRPSSHCLVSEGWNLGGI